MKIKILPFLFVWFVFTAAADAEDWKPAGERIVSIFAKDVDPKAPLPEYPRPQMTRNTWQNLNGLWDYAIVDREVEKVESFDGKILVPYPVESALSGVGRAVFKNQRLWYKRNFDIPKAWSGKRVLLHFGAVDWEATVWVNGKEVVKHTGGYTPFSADITDFFITDASQEIVVAVWDPTDDGSYQPRGKQVLRPGGIFYTAVTGIWQTVWLEPVAATSIERLKMEPNIKNGTLKLETVVDGVQRGDYVRASVTPSVAPRLASPNRDTRLRDDRDIRLRDARLASRRTTVMTGEPNRPLVLPVPNPRLWTPDDPFLYDLKVEIIRNNQVVDSVDSYFGMRESSLGKDKDGITKMMLNGQFVFQHGPLDQGWWPDGLYTAPTDEALAYDVAVTKQLGFNMLRKHVKVEPARFYYHCDKLGVLVWQDMPSGDAGIGGNDPDLRRSPESAANYEKEWKEIITLLYNHPSIVAWVPFNEGWGQFDTCRILAWTKELDPTRLVDGPSGWTDRGCGDMYDKHAYRGPDMFPPEENRATVLGEYGGLGLPVEGHLWVVSDQNWGYGGNLKDQDDLLETYKNLNTKMHPLIGKGLSAAVYTQTTDCEVEVNGLMTYDRAVIKPDVDKFRESNEALRLPPPTYRTIVPIAREKASEWAYTTNKPAEEWEKAEFDDTAWQRGLSGFGTAMTPNTAIGTEWKTGDIWVRKPFELSADDVKDPSKLVLCLYHDEDSEVYINGVKVLETKGYVTDYAYFTVKNAAEVFKPGTNVMAIHCLQTMGGQYIDAGISRIVP